MRSLSFLWQEVTTGAEYLCRLKICNHLSFVNSVAPDGNEGIHCSSEGVETWRPGWDAMQQYRNWNYFYQILDVNGESFQHVMTLERAVEILTKQTLLQASLPFVMRKVRRPKHINVCFSRSMSSPTFWHSRRQTTLAATARKSRSRERAPTPCLLPWPICLFSLGCL